MMRIEKIIINSEELLDAIYYNWRDRNERHRHIIWIDVSEETARASRKTEESGNYYPDELTPKPAHIAPREIADVSYGPPALYETEEHVDEYWPLDEYDDREAVVVDWHEEAIEMWRDDQRRQLPDETTVEIRGHDIPVEIIK